MIKRHYGHLPHSLVVVLEVLHTDVHLELGMVLVLSRPCACSGQCSCVFFCTCSSLRLGMLCCSFARVRLFSPAVGPLFSVIHHVVLDQHLSWCSGSQVSCHQDHPSVRVHPVCCLELCLLSGVTVCECVSLAPRAPYAHHLRSVVPWFVKGLRWFDELLPVHVLTHVFAARGPVSPRTTRSPPLRTLPM